MTAGSAVLQVVKATAPGFDLEAIHHYMPSYRLESVSCHASS